ncbi:hypothetical protein M655_009815 [Brevibacillus sp. NSP2.1]|uniref:hypothetical protein n=1 Tax=Brevibacillus sp. NSP2.1 TaxID=3003229 RepID=UPI00126652AD|nr:hypothetical protein [Brevibacillus sp. NSP2.1]QHZ55908.1 hypothetical protein M655_009815 [Brevibacillus sp. NSP2.1]
MPFKDIATTTGLVEETARNQVNKLIDLGVIEVVERNRIPKGKGLQRKLPNLYRLNIKMAVERESDESKMFVTEQMNNLKSCMMFYFTNRELKKMLPRKQYESLVALAS